MGRMRQDGMGRKDPCNSSGMVVFKKKTNKRPPEARSLLGHLSGDAEHVFSRPEDLTRAISNRCCRTSPLVTDRGWKYSQSHVPSALHPASFQMLDRQIY